MKRVVRTLLKNDEGKYLLVRHHKKGNWVLPGGHIENGETIYKTLKREIKEELNLEIKILGNKIGLTELDYLKEKPIPLCIYRLEYTNRNGNLTKKLEYVFLSEIKSGEVKIDESEIYEYKFFTVEEILSDSSVYTQTKEIIQKAL